MKDPENESGMAPSDAVPSSRIRSLPNEENVFFRNYQDDARKNNGMSTTKSSAPG